MMNSPNRDICSDCGMCCTHLIKGELQQIKPEDVDDAVSYYKGIRVKLFRYHGDTYYTIMKRKCKYYDGSGCSRYETRPRVCRRFPQVYEPHLAHYCPLMQKMRDDGEL